MVAKYREGSAPFLIAYGVMTQLADDRGAQTRTGRSPHWRRQSLLLAAGTFVVGTDAFVIAGLLPSIESTLRISPALAGQLVTVFSLAYALLAVPLAAATSAWSRRTILLVALATFALGNALTGAADTYPYVLAGRVVAAAGAALYTSSASATAAELAPAARTGRAIAIVLLGLTSSLVLGAPLGAALGATTSWRVTMLGIAAVALLVVPAVAVGIPGTLRGVPTGLRRRLAPLADRRVIVMLTRTFLVFTGIYLPYTYLSLVTTPTTRDHDGRLAVLLLVFGVAATGGNLAAGALSDRLGAGRVIFWGASALVVVFLLVGVVRDDFVLTVVAVAAFGSCSFLLNAPQQHQLIAHAPDTVATLTALHQAVLYLAVCASGVLGAVTQLHFGSAALPFVAAGFAATAPALTHALTHRLRYRTGAAT